MLTGPWRIAVCLLTLAGAACDAPGGRRQASPADEASPAAPRRLGAWKGRGRTTLGFVSESGSFRINWSARSEDAAVPGTFHLTLRSGISGRPLRVIAEHRGAGGGSVEFGDEPRLYEFLVEAEGIAWEISVDETFTSR